MLGLPLRTALLGLLAAVLSLAVSVVGLSAPALAADPAFDPASEPTAAPTGPVRILATGDSITHSRHGDRSWRYWVSRELTRQGVAFDNVGSYSTPYVDPGYPTSTYAVPFDGQHFAYAGQKLSGLKGRIAAEVREQKPDVVVLLAGINDLRGGATTADLEASLRAYIANVRNARANEAQPAPQPKILVGEVLASNRSDVIPRIPEVNAMYARVVDELTTPESPITLVDTGAGGWRANATYTFDGLHPNATGETLIAQNMAQGLYAARVLPSSPAGRIFHTEGWARTERVSVTTTGTRATLSWGHQAVTGGVARIREKGTATWRVSRLAPSRTTVAVEPGRTYETQVQMRRVWMKGPFGPVTTFRAARTAAGSSAGSSARPVAPRNAHLTRAGIRWNAVSGASYDVRYRTSSNPAWTSARTRAPRLTLGPARTAKVTTAQVRSVTKAGVSVWRAARR